MEGGGGGGGGVGGALPVQHPRTLEEIFKDFRGRRSGLLTALTHDVDEFVRLCDPRKENLCLYGYPDETWEVSLPVEEVPSELPEPILGINFSRDGMDRHDWLSLVAVHSDAWLLAVAFFYAARFDKGERKKLFGLISDLPSLYDVVMERKPVKGSSNNTKSKASVPVKPKPMQQPLPPARKDEEDEVEDDEEEHENTLCGKCGENYGTDEFWICCDICEQWFHGKCVKVTPAKAELIKQYKCPSCSSKKARV
ncbi:hypothetical protein GOP47_0022452 [Adiantum capillus-veneris]|uniref:PHD-type domain-containing protein n=1 Tax=Adiantum capillus-veneris TaxID=13818 RepID=A0A9D4Z498_ADICA|nr:hypothetical protein GOP47_0022452 [Adiantum capillus-veneris]